ncbi:MAG TPA: peptidoglycan-binding domain-containing protein [Terriglobales bacterium]|nr:peptidoglycan-binding domain-containing protein [Terriglobales bacterium]
MRRAIAVGAVPVLAAGVVAAALAVHGRQAPVAATTAVPVGTARVTRTDIVSRQRINGTLGYGAPWTVTAPAGTPPDALRQAQASVTGAQAAQSAAGQADQDTAAAGQLAVSQAQAAVTAAGSNPTALAAAQQQLATAQQRAEQAQHQADAQLAAARVATQNAQAALQMAQSSARLDGSVTWLPAPGAVVQQGQTLYAVAGRPVVVLNGAVPAYRELAPGASGDDVRQLERDLIDLGFATAADLAVDGSFTGADAAAVSRWQAALGVPQTGVVRLGEVVFAPGPVRVAAVHAALGAEAAPAAPLLDLTSTRHTVTAQLDTAHQQLVHPGDQVSVLMPDGRTNAAGTVTDVSRVATQATTGQGQGGQGGPQQLATVAVTVTLADESSAGTLDQAPVFVSITTASKKGVLAVPVTALLAQPNGDYAVAVRSGDERRVVTVQPGLFGDGGLVEVSGAGLAEGQLVEVPAQ